MEVNNANATEDLPTAYNFKIQKSRCCEGWDKLEFYTFVFFIPQYMLTVEKIGGTSMSALKEVIDNVVMFDRTDTALYNRIFVVSPFSGVANLLLENKKTKAPGVLPEAG